MSACHCDCCTGTSVQTPVEAANPPGLDTLAHRVGTHGEFLSTMLARLSSPAYPALRALTVRTADDPAIGLLDATAVLADLLSFYTERTANEGYLRTATEERSLTLLGRLVGHTPRPGVAAGTYLAYTVDADPRHGGDLQVRVPRGARAQSVPGQGEDPQPFETMEELLARWSWNDLKVRRRRPYQLTLRDLDTTASGGPTVLAAGVNTNLKPGDRLLFVFGSEVGRQRLQEVSRVDLDRENDLTVIGRPKPALPDLKSLRDGLRKLLDPLVGPKPPEIVGRSVILQRFVKQVLKPVRDRVGADKTPQEPGELTTPTKFVAALDYALERLSETLDVAAHYTHIRDWLRAQGEELGRLRLQATQLEPRQPAEPPPLFTALGLDGVPANPAVLGLGALLGALRTPPTRPPASSRDLARDPAALFAPGSDLTVQLLAALDPRVRDGLYAAWRQVDLTAPLALQELLAMRVVAAPFGATAPPRTIPNRDGTVRQEEWELYARLSLQLKVNYDKDGKPDTAELVFSSDVETWRETLRDLSEPLEVDFGPGRVKIEPEDGVVKFGFAKHLPERSITVHPTDGAGKLRFVIANGSTIDLSLEPDRVHFAQHQGASLQVRHVSKKDSVDAFISFDFSSFALSPRNVLALDAVYEGIGVGSWVVVERPRKGQPAPGEPPHPLATVTARVTGVRVIARQAFGVSGKVTELVLDRPWLDSRDILLSQLRDATVYARGDTLRLAQQLITGDVSGGQIELAQLYDGLTPGRWVIVSGERTDIPGQQTGVRGTELAMIAGVQQGVDPQLPGDQVHTTVTLATELAYRYRRETVHLYANVARATNGAGRDEPIGSGDASKPSQSFLLRQGPLTWLAADNPRGAASTLDIRVDGVRWHETDSFIGTGPQDQVYVTEPFGDNSIRVVFGDGVRGARLPTGVENVRASYRVGLGKAANVTAGQITQLTTRPLGLSAVTNPLPATGGADRDDAGQLRRTIPLRVMAFDRLVSVPDYEDFARARAGIGRASARRLFNGIRDTVHVTVAGVDDIPLADDSDIVTTLRAALAGHGDAALPAEVAVREAVLLVVSANIRVLPDYSWELVEPAVRRALGQRLGFAARELGKPAYLSEVLAAAQAVSGVDHVDVDVFTGVPASITPVGLDRLVESMSTPSPVVPARLAVFDQTRYTVAPPPGIPTETLTAVAAKHGITVAELLRLNPDLADEPDDPQELPRGRSVLVFRGVRPAQLVLLSPAVPDTLILKEVRP